MTNRIALLLILAVAALATIDFLWLDARALVFLARKFITFSEYLAFWR